MNPFAGADPKWFTAIIVSAVLVLFGAIAAIGVSDNDKPDTKTQLQTMGFVFVELENDYYAHVSLPGVAGMCQIDVHKNNETWELYRPSLSDEKPVITSAEKAKKLPIVQQWCGLPK